MSWAAEKLLGTGGAGLGQTSMCEEERDMRGARPEKMQGAQDKDIEEEGAWLGKGWQGVVRWRKNVDGPDKQDH